MFSFSSFRFLLVFVILTSTLSINSQKRIVKGNNIQKMSNSFMDNISDELYKITNYVESDGSFHIKSEINTNEAEVLKSLGATDDFDFKFKRTSKSYIDSEVTYKFYEQYYKNLLVDGGGYLTTMKNSKLVKFAPNLYLDLNISIQPSLFDSEL